MRVENSELHSALQSADLFILGLGYEPRCTNLAELACERLLGKAYAIGYSYSRFFAYEASAARFASLGVEVIDHVSDDDFHVHIKELLRRHPAAKTVVVDISALNRARMAALVEVMCGDRLHSGMSIYFSYSGGKFVPPPIEVVQNESIGPMGVAFSGMLAAPELPSEIVVGLGYETGKALGAVEYLQCSDVWLFVPSSVEGRFEVEVVKSNQLLLDQVGPAKTLQYRVEDPAGTFVDMRSVLHGMANRANPMLLPLGPKVFALVCLLIAVSDKSVSVWRASQGKYEVHIPREASGHTTTLLVCADLPAAS